MEFSLVSSKHSFWWRRLEDVFRLRLQKMSSRRLDQDEYIRLSHTSSRRLQGVLIKTNIFALAIRLQDAFKRLQDALPRRLQNFFKTSSRRLAKMSSRYLQDVFKTSSRYLQDVFKTSWKLLTKTSLRRLQDVCKTFWIRLQDVLQRCLQDFSKTYHRVKLFGWVKDVSRSHFQEIYGQCRKFASVIKISQVLVFHFTTSFSGCLQMRF